MPLLALILFVSSSPECDQLSAQEDAQQIVIRDAISAMRVDICGNRKRCDAAAERYSQESEKMQGISYARQVCEKAAVEGAKQRSIEDEQAAQKKKLDEDNEAVAKANAANAAEYEAMKPDIIKKAKRKGFTEVDFDGDGLIATVNELRSGQILQSNISKMLFVLDGVDYSLRVLQVIDQNNVLFQDDFDHDTVYWFKNYRAHGGKTTWLTGATLGSTQLSYVAIRGTKAYRSAFGPRQAIVVEFVF